MTQPLRVVILKPSKYTAEGYVERFRWGFMPNSTVPYMRGMTPAEVKGTPTDVHPIDEYVHSDLRYLSLLRRPRGGRTVVALVGVQSHQFHRALDLAAYARRNGSMAVIGGPHVMTCDTSLLHGRGVSFALAEAELVWPEILRDAARGELRPVYGQEQRWQQELEAPVIIPPSRRDLSRYIIPMLGLYPARGCPFLCNFCSVTKIAGRRIRSQSISTTLSSFCAARVAGVRTIMFTSDNFNKYPGAEALLTAMVEERLGLQFFVQCDTQIARQEHLVALLARAGCFQMFVGVESFNRETLLAAAKGQNRPEMYRDIVRLCREHGISSHFSNIIGFPQDAEQQVIRHLETLRAMVAVADLQGIVVDDSEAKAIGAWVESKSVAGFVGAGYRTDMGEDKGTKTLTYVPKIPKSGRSEVRFSYTAATNRSKKVPIHIFHADGQETIFIDETQAPPIDGHFISLGKFRFEQDGAGYVLVSNEGTKGHVVADAVQFIPEEEVAAGSEKEAPPAKSEGPDRRKLVESRVKEIEAEMKKLTNAGPHRPTTMTVREEDQIADTNIRIRGLVGQPGVLVPRGFLRVLATPAPPAISQKESGRRELADWLVSPDNPLTARVFVNRVWSLLFGAGIVRTTENFGTTGEAPSHPELLDHLALRFVEQGWSVKKLIREMVLSHTWQLGVNADRGTRNAENADPDNRLLAHANRRRLDAEQIRDTILTVSSELQLTVGGPNIAGANENSPAAFEYTYEFGDTRRSVYTPAFRNKRLELFEVFDFGDINAPVGRRNVSTVAPQALYLLNHSFVVAQAKLAAERALASSARDDERLTNAFRAALCRPPGEQERALCAKFVAGADEKSRVEVWSEVYQTLFGCLDFRYLE